MAVRSFVTTISRNHETAPDARRTLLWADVGDNGEVAFRATPSEGVDPAQLSDEAVLSADQLVEPPARFFGNQVVARLSDHPPSSLDLAARIALIGFVGRQKGVTNDEAAFPLSEGTTIRDHYTFHDGYIGESQDGERRYGMSVYYPGMDALVQLENGGTADVLFSHLLTGGMRLAVAITRHKQAPEAG